MLFLIVKLQQLSDVE